jgi:hypothetical protein
MILGYPWFAAAQPKINWAKGWIDYLQLPIVLQVSNANQACFRLRVRGQLWMQIQVATQDDNLSKVPEHY